MRCNCAVHAKAVPKAAVCPVLRCNLPGLIDVSVSAVIAIGETAQVACNQAVEKILKAALSQLILLPLGPCYA